MKLGIAIEETWSFFNEIYDELNEHHQVNLYKRNYVTPPIFSERINRRLYQYGWSKFLRENDVVFFEWASELLSYATQQEKTCGIVTRLHRYEMYKWLDLIDWSVVDKIIVVSEAKKREFYEHFPQYASKTVVIPEAVSVNKFSPKPRSFNGDIGILCNLIPRKRVYETILAFYELNKQKNGFHLHIGGGEHVLHKDYYRALRAIVRELGMDSQVSFYGNVKDPETWYENIDIFISNSYSEGLQVAPMEAMASGCFVLSHNWEGADELLPGENLFVTNEDLITKILDFCSFSEEVKQFRKSMLRNIVIEKFNIDQIKTQIRSVIESVTST